MESLSTTDRLLRDLESSRQRPLRRRSTGDIRQAVHSPQKATSRLLLTQDRELRNESPGDEAPSGKDEAWITELAEADRTTTWRPWWLRANVLFSFTALFVSFIIALGAMFWYSTRNNGMFTAHMKGVEYVCRFILTAILTLVAALWARVELQACRYTPWYALYQSQSPDKVGCDLDYTSMILPTLLFRSLRQKHYFLFLAVMISFLFKIQIVLSPGLFQVVEVEMTENSTLLLLDIFDITQNHTFNRGRGHSAYYVARNLFDFDTPYPFGVTKKAAFQRFAERGSETSLLTTTVEALFVDFDCIKLKEYELIDWFNEESYGEMEFVLELHFEGCPKVPWHIFNITNPNPYDFQYWMYNDTLSPEHRCSKLPHGRQFIYLIASFYEINYDPPPYVDEVAAIMCGSNVRLSTGKVVDNGTTPTLEEVDNSSQTEYDIDIWAMILDSIPWTGDWWNADYTHWVNVDKNNNPVWTWQHFKSATHRPDPASPDPLNTTEVLFESVTGLANNIGILFGHYRMRQERETKTDRDLLVKVKRVIVSIPTAISMLGIFGLILVIATFMIGRYRRDTKTLYMDPATLLGSLVFLHDHPTVTNRILNLQDENGSESWHKDSFLPYAIRPWVRTTFTISVVGVVAAITTTLIVSRAQAGIGSPGGYWYLLWTSLPVLAMLGISLYTSSSDTASRNIWSLHNLSKEPSSVRQLSFSMLDMSGPRVLLTACQLRAWPVCLSQTLALLCASLTTVASILFTVDWNVMPDSLQLKQSSWFADKTMTPTKSAYETLVSRLLVGRAEGDMPYPKNTYDNFLFPEIVTPSLPSKNVSLQVQMPAASLEPFCTRVADETGDVRSTITNTNNNWTRWDAEVLFAVTLPNGTKLGMNESMNVVSYNDTSEHARETFFAIGGVTSPTTRFYIWGGWSWETKDVFFLRAYHCNYIWTRTLMDVNLIVGNNELVIDRKNTPRPLDRTSEPWNPQFSFRNYAPYASIWPDLEGDRNTTFDVDPELMLLLKPYGPFEPEDLGNPSLEDDIKEAINHNWAFVRAQVANQNNRLGLNDTAVLVNLPPEGLHPISAKLIDHNKRRLFQSPEATYLILGILGSVVVVNILMLVPKTIKERLGWKIELFNMEVKQWAPDGFHSISRMVALLHSSNSIQHMSSQVLSTDEQEKQLENLRFRFGWFEKQIDKTRHLTVGVEGDEEFVFLGAPMDGIVSESESTSTASPPEA